MYEWKDSLFDHQCPREKLWSTRPVGTCVGLAFWVDPRRARPQNTFKMEIEATHKKNMMGLCHYKPSLHIGSLVVPLTGFANLHTLKSSTQRPKGREMYLRLRVL